METHYSFKEWKTKTEVIIFTDHFEKTFEMVQNEYSVKIKKTKFGQLTEGSIFIKNIPIHSITNKDWKKIEHLFKDEFKSYFRDKKIDIILS
jgi:hypothetical protein